MNVPQSSHGYPSDARSSFSQARQTIPSVSWDIVGRFPECCFASVGLKRSHLPSPCRPQVRPADEVLLAVQSHLSYLYSAGTNTDIARCTTWATNGVLPSTSPSS